MPPSSSPPAPDRRAPWHGMHRGASIEKSICAIATRDTGGENPANAGSTAEMTGTTFPADSGVGQSRLGGKAGNTLDSLSGSEIDR